MNHIIKLPKKAIENIFEKKNELFILKYFPSNFDHKRDSLIVEEEETGLIHGTMKIDSVYRNNSILKTLLQFHRQIAYIRGDFLSYIGRKRGYYVFHVYSVIRYK